MKVNARSEYSTVVIGASAGALHALKTILPSLAADFVSAVILVVHRHPDSNRYMEEFLNSQCKLDVKQAEEKETIQGGIVYIAPPNYHLMIEDDHTFSLSVENAVNYARPSIDVLFESAADVYGSNLIGVILTGNNNDGSHGLKQIKSNNGLTIVQTPESAEADGMPWSAIKATTPEYVLHLEAIGPFLNAISTPRNKLKVGGTFADNNQTANCNATSYPKELADRPRQPMEESCNRKPTPIRNRNCS